MKIIKNYIYNASYQILVIIVPLITTPYVNRILGPYGIGINTFTNTIIQYFILAGSLGISLYGNQQIAYVRNDKIKMARTFWEIQIIKTIGIIISSIAFFVYLIFLSNYKWYMLLQFSNLFATAFDISWLFQGIENFKITVLRNTFVKLISVFLIFLLIHTSGDIGIYILISGISTFLGNLTLWPTVHRVLPKIKFLRLNPWKHIGPAVALFIPQVALQVYQVLNKTILGILVNVQSSGFYYDADTIIKMLLSLITALGTVMLPHAANAFAMGHKEKINKMMYLSSEVTTCVTMAFSFGLAAISLKLAPIFFGKPFFAVGPAMMIEAPVIYLAGFSGVLGTQYLLPTNQVKPYTISLILGAVVSIIFNFILIPVWQLAGAMIATVLSELSVTIYQLYYLISSKQLILSNLFKDFYKYFVSGFIMFIVVFYLDLNLSKTILSLVIEITFGVIIYVGSLWLFKANSVLVLKKILKK